jgi:hypothetical protein
VSGEEPDERQVSPWPILRQVSDEECWQNMSDADIEILGMGRDEWEKNFDGNPCNNPRRD